MADIFLSYARADQAQVETFAASLEEAGYSVWWDRHIRGGSEFSKDIEAAIAAAKAVIVVWSAASTESEWVREEASFARDHNKLVPVSFDNATPPFGFGQRQAIDLNADGSREQLRKALDALVGSEHETVATDVQGGRSRLSPLLLAIPVLLLAAVAAWYFIPASEEAGDTQIALEDKRGVMVLPFIAQSSGADDQYFADGLTEEILNRLDALDELRVVPRTTAFSYRNTEQTVEAIAEEAGVGHIVEGSLRRDGERVRITARLIAAGGEQTVWSENYEATADDVFKVQADIAEKVASSLDILLDSSKLQAMQGAGIDNPEAFAIFAKGYDLYLRAHSELEDLTLFAQSIPVFDEAFAMEPRLAQSQIYAADFYSHIVMDAAGGVKREELPEETRNNALAQLRDRLTRARDAEPQQEARMAIDLFRTAFSDDWSDLTRDSERFYSREANCASSAWPGFGYSVYGNADKVFDLYVRQMDCGDLQRNFWAYLSFNALLAGETDRLEEVIERGRSLPIPQGPLSIAEVFLELGRGNLEEARRLAEERDNAGTRYMVAAALGDTEGLPPMDWVMGLPPYKSIQWLAIMGEQKRADDWAAQIDAAPAGPSVLQIITDECLCGAPFDISRTPNFRARLNELGVSWPPKSPIDWPLRKAPGE